MGIKTAAVRILDNQGLPNLFRGRSKYVLVQVQESDKRDNAFLLLCANQNKAYHADILIDLRNSFPHFIFVPQGGGVMSIDPDRKITSFYGESGTYGEADHETARKIFEDAYSEYGPCKDKLASTLTTTH